MVWYQSVDISWTVLAPLTFFVNSKFLGNSFVENILAAGDAAVGFHPPLYIILQVSYQ
uniref:Uncharacterized protein n=1 Tax=Anguilla anguilla TaxID=7936 RepID=A0A0E9XHY0_ANGAN